MNNTLKHGLLILALLVPLAANSASGSAATAFPSLKLEKGARLSALGGAYSALANNVDSLYWNPAGLVGMRRLEIMASHQNWIEDIYHQELAFGLPWYGVGAWGVGATYMSTELEGRDDFGIPTENFQAFDFSLMAALSLEWSRWFSSGASYRILRQGYGDQFSMGSSFDVGVQFRKLWDRRLTLGLVSANMGTDVSLGQSLGPLPWEIRGGAALALFDRALSVAAEVGHQPHAAFTKFRFGAEYAASMGGLQVALRSGYVIGPQQLAGDSAGLTLGAGLGAGGIAVDYAWVPVGDFGSSHKVTLTYRFD